MMANTHGEFVWYELMTSDAAGAQAFYGPLLGWDFADSGVEGVAYFMISKDGVELGGLMEIAPEMAEGGTHPGWIGYVEVDDVDASAARAANAGAKVVMGPEELPDNIGRFGMFIDPQGVPLYIMHSNSAEPSQAFARYEPQDGHCAWNELVTADPAAAKAFYGELFGWEKADELDMGPMGLYEMFRVSDYTFGAIMQKPEMMPMSAWVYYLRVPDINAAADYVKGNGGQVMTEPIQIPGGDFILNGMDPQGAFFALIGKGEVE